MIGPESEGNCWRYTTADCEVDGGHLSGGEALKECTTIIMTNTIMYTSSSCDENCAFNDLTREAKNWGGDDGDGFQVFKQSCTVPPPPPPY